MGSRTTSPGLSLASCSISHAVEKRSRASIAQHGSSGRGSVGSFMLA
jgi:hypothetical protein